jgi:hypothetical protein
MYPVRIYEVHESDYNAFAQALKHLDTRRWGFVPYTEIEQYNDGATLEAIGFMDEEGELYEIIDYLDSYGFHFGIEEL